MFLCSAAAICGLATSLKKSERSSKRERPSVRFPIQAGSRVSFALLLFLSLVAGLQPFVRSHSKSLTPSNAQTGPTLPPLASALVSSGNLQQVALEPRDAIFAKDFPGRIQRYRGATSELLVRSVFTATRSLHPSSDCFRGLGYSIVPLPSEKDAEGHLWGCFEARSSARSLHVCEHVVSAKNGHWSDIPSWFWSATFRPESGPWNALTRIETKSPLSEAKTTLHTDFTQLSS